MDEKSRMRVAGREVILALAAYLEVDAYVLENALTRLAEGKKI